MDPERSANERHYNNTLFAILHNFWLLKYLKNFQLDVVKASAIWGALLSSSPLRGNHWFMVRHHRAINFYSIE